MALELKKKTNKLINFKHSKKQENYSEFEIITQRKTIKMKINVNFETIYSNNKY